MEGATEKDPGLDYVVEKLATCTELLTKLEESPETPEFSRMHRELKEVQRRLLRAACAFGPPENAWLAR